MFNDGAYPLRVGTSTGYIQFAGDREPSLGVDLMVLAADEMYLEDAAAEGPGESTG
jgi:hypothetical protein